MLIPTLDFSRGDKEVDRKPWPIAAVDENGLYPDQQRAAMTGLDAQRQFETR